MNIIKMLLRKNRVYRIKFVDLKGEIATVLVKANNRGDAFKQIDRIFGREVSVTDIGIMRD